MGFFDELNKSEHIEYRCPVCKKPLEVNFDEVETLFGKNFRCERCRTVLHIEYGQKCSYCKTPFQKIDFKEDDIERGGKRVRCSLCQEMIFVPIEKKDNLPMVIIE